MISKQTKQAKPNYHALGLMAYLSLGAALLLWGCTAVLLQEADNDSAPPNSLPANEIMLTGYVFGADGPAEGVRVQVQATDYLAETDVDGAFVIPMPAVTEPITVVAWRQNHYFTYTQVIPAQLAAEQGSIELTIERHHRGDNLDYEWEPSENCAECHTANDEWLLIKPINSQEHYG